jgi:hypothetical protein
MRIPRASIVSYQPSLGRHYAPSPTVTGAVLGVGATFGGVLLGATFGTMSAPVRW